MGKVVYKEKVTLETDIRRIYTSYTMYMSIPPVAASLISLCLSRYRLKIKTKK